MAALSLRIGRQLLILGLTLIVIVSSLLVPLAILPGLLYRWLVRILAKLWRPDLGSIMAAGNSFFALNSLTQTPKATVVLVLEFQGSFSLDHDLMELFRVRVLDKKKKAGKNRNGSGDADELVYPELRQTWTSFMGYLFWKPEPNFDLTQHARYYDFEPKDGFSLGPDGIACEDDIRELGRRLLSAPWKPDFSPWEILYVRRYRAHKNSGGDLKSVAILRFSHAMGDGLGWMNLLLNDLLQMKNPVIPRPSAPTRSPWSLLTFPVKLPYDFVKNFVESYDSANPWHTQGKRCRQHLTSTSASFPVERIKKLKNKFGLSYSAILISVISGAIRRVMEEAGQKVPKKMMGFASLPWPNHPGGICIHATGLYTRWPIEVKEPVQRLEEVSRDLEEKQSSLFPVGLYWLAQFMGLFPTIIPRIMYNRMMCTLMVSLFPGPLNTPEFQGYPVSDAALYLGLPAGNSGSSVATVVMGGTQRVTTVIDQSLFPSAAIFSRLGQFIQDELEALEKAAVPSCMLKGQQQV